MRVVVMQRGETGQYFQSWVVHQEGEEKSRLLPPEGPREDVSGIGIGKIDVVNVEEDPGGKAGDDFEVNAHYVRADFDGVSGVDEEQIAGAEMLKACGGHLLAKLLNEFDVP